MKTTNYIIALMILIILILSCDEPVDDIYEPINLLIGNWAHKNTSSEIFIVSNITQETIDINKTLPTPIEVTGAEYHQLNRFFYGYGFMSGDFIRVSNAPILEEPQLSLQIVDNDTAYSATFKSSVRSYYNSDVNYSYNQTTGELIIPDIILWDIDSVNSVNISGNTLVPMLTLTANDTIVGYREDSTKSIGGIEFMNFTEPDSLIVWTYYGDADTGRLGNWVKWVDSLKLSYSSTERLLGYSISNDTLILRHTIAGSYLNAGVYFYGFLEPNSLDSSWWVYESLYLR